MLFFFFFNDTATTEIYTLSLHDALPIYAARVLDRATYERPAQFSEGIVHVLVHGVFVVRNSASDRKSTRLNSSHLVISYAVFCLKKNNITSDTIGLVASSIKF